MEIHKMVFLVSRAANNYASYRGKPVKFITCLPGLDETQIVDEENDFPSLVRPGQNLIWQSTSCTKTIVIYLFCTLRFRQGLKLVSILLDLA